MNPQAPQSPLPTGRDPASIRRRIEAMEYLLERSIFVPGLQRRLGLDVVLNIIPIIGDLIGTALGAWLIWEARNLGMSRFQIARMGANVAFDTLLGAIPWIGAIPDYFFRSNSRNLRIILKHLDRHHPGTRTIEGSAVEAGPVPRD